jgi:hypothetical protein
MKRTVSGQIRKLYQRVFDRHLKGCITLSRILNRVRTASSPSTASRIFTRFIHSLIVDSSEAICSLSLIGWFVSLIAVSTFSSASLAWCKEKHDR